MAVMNHTMPDQIFNNCDGLLYCMSSWASNVTNGMFWAAMLIGFQLILFISTQKYGTARSFGFAAVMGLMASLWLATAQLIAWWIATMFIIVGCIGFVVLITNEK